MKKNIKKTMISCFAGVGLMALCAGVMPSIFASASSASTDFTGATQASATEFYEVPGASIRVDGNKSGIRFQTVLTKGYHNTLKDTGSEVEYISVMKSGTLVVERTHTDLDLDTYFTTNDSLDLFASLTFNKDGGTLPEGVTWHDLYAWDFEVDTYAKVTASDNTITYYKAYESGTVRSMREVANAAYYDETGNHYQSEVIKDEYFKNPKEVTSTESYIKKVDGVSYLDVTGANFDETVSVYEGVGKDTKRVDGTYIASNGKIQTTLTPIVDENGEEDNTVNEKWVTVFDADNNMYRLKINRFVTEYISDVGGLKNITHAPNRASTPAYVGDKKIYVLTKGIDLSNETGWNPQEYGRTYFMGTLDGQGYAIEGLNLDKGSNNTSGLFDSFHGNATIKNLALLDVTLDKNYQTAPLAGEVLKDANVTIENVFVTVNAITFVYYQSGLITQAEKAATITCKDVFIQVEEINIAPATGCYAGVPRNGFMVGRLATVAEFNVSNAFFVAPTVTALEDQTYNKLSVTKDQVISLKIVGLATSSPYITTEDDIKDLATEGTHYYQSSSLKFDETTKAKMTDMIKKYYTVISAK